MAKSVKKFFWMFLTSQERWLNKMSEEGYRLTGTTIGGYEFEDCTPGKYRYRVENIANKSKQSAEEYRKTLETCGYRVFYKNANLNYSVGKAEYRPWAEKGGRIANEKTTLHKELLIIEKENDGEPFLLCTSFEIRYGSYKRQRLWGIVGFVIAIALGIIGKSVVWGLLAIFPLLWMILFHVEIEKLKKSELEQWIRDTDEK